MTYVEKLRRRRQEREASYCPGSRRDPGPNDECIECGKVLVLVDSYQTVPNHRPPRRA